MPWESKSCNQMRMEFIQYVRQASVTMTEACEKFHISRKTGYKWLRRYESAGAQGLRDMCRAPKNQPTKLSTEVICRIISIRQAHKSWGADKIQSVLRRESLEPIPARSTIHRILRKSGMIDRPRRRRNRVEQVRLDESKGEEPAVNDEWTIDFKGWWYSRDGKRKCYPLTIRDAASRYVLAVTLLSDCREESVRAAMTDTFKKYGLPKSIRSDNGPPFACTQALLGLSKLSIWWIRLGIKLKRGRVGCPQDNGAHERMHKDMSAELEAEHADTQAEMDEWRDCYNYQRPHAALTGKTPGEVYTPSERKFKASMESWDYGENAVRIIDKHGDLKWKGVDYFLSEALRGERVGVYPLDDHTYEVRFAEHVLGTVDIRAEMFAPRVKAGSKQPYIKGRKVQRAEIKEVD